MHKIDPIHLQALCVLHLISQLGALHLLPGHVPTALQRAMKCQPTHLWIS